MWHNQLVAISINPCMAKREEGGGVERKNQQKHYITHGKDITNQVFTMLQYDYHSTFINYYETIPLLCPLYFHLRQSLFDLWTDNSYTGSPQSIYLASKLVKGVVTPRSKSSCFGPTISQ